MKRTLYIETTVVSYYTARPSRDLVIAARQEATRELWPRLAAEYETYVSAVVYEEAARGDQDQAKRRVEALTPFPILQITEEARRLAQTVVENGGVPKEFPEDALHVALAATNGVEVLLTWNFAHLNNPFTQMMVRQAVENAGYRCPVIASPDALLEVER